MIKAVKQNGYVLQYCHNPSEKVQLEAVKQNGDALQYCHNPSEEIQIEAVKQDGYALRYCHNPSEEIQIEAVKQNGYALQYCHKYIPKIAKIVKNKNYDKLKTKKKMTISEICEKLGYEIEIVN